MTIQELAQKTMAREDIYDASHKGLFEWEDYLIGRLDEAGLAPQGDDKTTRVALFDLSRELVRIWKPELPRWELAEVMATTASQDAKTMRAVEKLLAEAQAYCGARLVYQQNGHEWEVIELKAGKISGTPQARVKSGRWFCFTSPDGFSVKGGRV